MRSSRELVAFKDIKKGEQIFLDYAMNNTSEWRMECCCGSKHCRKLIGNFSMLDEETQKKYLNYISDRARQTYLEGKK